MQRDERLSFQVETHLNFYLIRKTNNYRGSERDEMRLAKVESARGGTFVDAIRVLVRNGPNTLCLPWDDLFLSFETTFLAFLSPIYLYVSKMLNRLLYITIWASRAIVPRENRKIESTDLDWTNPTVEHF